MTSSQDPALRENLKRHVIALSDEIGERHFFRYEHLQKAARYVSGIFKEYGYNPEWQTYHWGNQEYSNIIATQEGSKDPGKIIIAGAHYDTVRGTPGADDNASGAAGILELSRMLSNEDIDKTIKFIAFVNEEPPFFRTRNMGSRIYSKQAKKNKEDIIAMFSFEMIGYFSEEEKSQHYPFGIRLWYPTNATFIALVGNIRFRKFVKRVAEIFRKHSDFDLQSIAMPSIIPGIDFSDHWSFWREGYNAAMITDTAFYRYHDYHGPRDTYEKLDYGKMAAVVDGFKYVLKELAS